MLLCSSSCVCVCMFSDRSLEGPCCRTRDQNLFISAPCQVLYFLTHPLSPYMSLSLSLAVTVCLNNSITIGGTFALSVLPSCLCLSPMSLSKCQCVFKLCSDAVKTEEVLLSALSAKVTAVSLWETKTFSAGLYLRGAGSNWKDSQSVNDRVQYADHWKLLHVQSDMQI